MRYNLYLLDQKKNLIHFQALDQCGLSGRSFIWIIPHVMMLGQERMFSLERIDGLEGG